jgi:hypothetical protein
MLIIPIFEVDGIKYSVDHRSDFTIRPIFELINDHPVSAVDSYCPWCEPQGMRSFNGVTWKKVMSSSNNSHGEQPD